MYLELGRCLYVASPLLLQEHLATFLRGEQLRKLEELTTGHALCMSLLWTIYTRHEYLLSQPVTGLRAGGEVLVICVVQQCCLKPEMGKVYHQFILPLLRA